MNFWVFLVIYFCLNIVATYIFGRMGEFRYNSRSSRDRSNVYQTVALSVMIGSVALVIFGVLVSLEWIVDLVRDYTEVLDPLRPLRNLFNIGPRDEE